MRRIQSLDLTIHRGHRGDHERPSVRGLVAYKTSRIEDGGAPRHKARRIPGGTSDSVSRSALVLMPTFTPITITIATKTATAANQPPTSRLRVMCFTMVTTLLRVVPER